MPIRSSYLKTAGACSLVVDQIEASGFLGFPYLSAGAGLLDID